MSEPRARGRLLQRLVIELPALFQLCDALQLAIAHFHQDLPTTQPLSYAVLSDLDRFALPLESQQPFRDVARRFRA